MKKRDILITAALPYANGGIHLGHLVEYIQADVWNRFQRLQGHDSLYICGDDAHGTAIMLSAQKKGISPEVLIEQTHKEHSQDLAGFYVEFDNFHTTHSEENRELSAMIYQRLKDQGAIHKKTITQAYDPVENMFLPDRFIRGECPKCSAKDQYGDNCESCGTTYSPTDLINPISAVSGARPIEKDSEHYFFNLEDFQDFLLAWINSGHLQPQITNKLKEWFDTGLQPWDISRDAPYFGFQIPGTTDKYFYVWLDAPIGYMASLKNLCKRRPEISFDHYWGKDSTAELYHFVGKDIIYFHALFWPAMLKGADFRTPTNIFTHGYLTVNGQKMSKSRGTFINARQYLQHLEPEYFRYYICAKLTPVVEDIDLNFQDFMLRVNSDLVGKYVNLASRCAGFISKKFNGLLADKLPDPALFDEFITAGDSIQQLIEGLNYNKALREIMQLADRANQYIDQKKPWILAKEEGQELTVQGVCTQGLNLFKVLTAYLKPILPVTAQKVEEFLAITPLNYSNCKLPLLDHAIKKFKPLIQRITPEAIDQLTSSEPQ
jgi:methionyl-tRNA synthetase